MYVSDLALDDFRSYRHAVVKLQPGVTVFIGPNGQGKTNLVEAIAYLATLSSHRAGSDVTLVRHEAAGGPANAAVVRVRAHDGGREHLVDVEIVAGKANRARLNRDPVKPRQIAGIVQTVVFAPEDLALVRGEPGGRRRFLDELITQTCPAHALVRSEHERILRQRGALLKQLRASGGAQRVGDPQMEATLAAWDQHLAQVAAQIMLARRDIVRALSSHVRTAYSEVAGAGRELAIAYTPASIPAQQLEQADETTLATALLEQMQQRRHDELVRGVNLVGAHRDDLTLLLGTMPVKHFASHGESWSVALALKIGSFRVLSANAGSPILILDDVFAELDTQRRDAVAAIAACAEQVLITAAVAHDVPQALAARAIHVRLDATQGSVLTVEDGELARDGDAGEERDSDE